MARIRREIEDEPTPIMRWGDMTEAIKPLEVHVEMSDETAANLREMGEPEPDTYHGIPVVTDENDGNFLSEVADIIKDAWLCPCGYQNNGPICTKCGATHNE